MPDTTVRSRPWRRGLGLAAALPLVLGLITAFATMRSAGMLGPASLRWLLPLSFCLMAIMPWVLLRPDGRRQIGLARPASLIIFIPALACGALAAAVCFALGVVLYGSGTDNWFVSIANNYRVILDTSNFSLIRLHLAFTLPALIFSPIGEEIFFRGLVQRAFEEHLSSRASTITECAAFAVVHLCHHGLLRSAAGIGFLPVSGAIWVVLMFI